MARLPWPSTSASLSSRQREAGHSMPKAARSRSIPSWRLSHRREGRGRQCHSPVPGHGVPEEGDAGRDTEIVCGLQCMTKGAELKAQFSRYFPFSIFFENAIVPAMSDPKVSRLPFHYAWVIVVTGCSASWPAWASAGSRSACCSHPWRRRSSYPTPRSALSAPATSSATLLPCCSAAM